MSADTLRVLVDVWHASHIAFVTAGMGGGTDAVDAAASQGAETGRARCARRALWLARDPRQCGRGSMCAQTRRACRMVSWPCGVVVSAHVSLRDRKPAPARLTDSRTLSRSSQEVRPLVQQHLHGGLQRINRRMASSDRAVDPLSCQGVRPNADWSPHRSPHSEYR
jgi:hypothetical protein